MMLNKEYMEEKKLNLKPFDLEAAKTGKPVCTRDGRKARIICFDKKDINYPIVALIEENKRMVRKMLVHTLLRAITGQEKDVNTLVIS